MIKKASILAINQFEKQDLDFKKVTRPQRI
ncbi:hypothetical protein X927_08360 [Petrotoga mexicana DSM 14811]|uniref:Uncharacterized protein n=1 Tax=Petrotoga mexicana DSM 14811 TaxID=1122954 RepID=A0A2K1P6H6_9BACT|nr:hypothetical protein X927_08360 [Petrotoga mexicana DSM 14811]